MSGSASGSVKVWDLECNKRKNQIPKSFFFYLFCLILEICNLVGHKTSVTCLEYHNYADYIASGSIDSQIRVKNKI